MCLRGYVLLLFSVLQLLASSAGWSQAPSINPDLTNKNRIINEVHFQLVPAEYLSIGGTDKYGAEVSSFAVINSAGTAVDTAQFGDIFNERRLVDSWSGTYPKGGLDPGAFRFTPVPSASLPFNQAAGFLLSPPADTTRVDLTARDLYDYGTGGKHCRITVTANGIVQGSAITFHAGWATYQYPVALKDRLNFQITGAGSATITAIYLYNTKASSAPIKSLEGLSLAVPAGGAVVSYDSPYAGPATDCAVRVQGTGVDATTRLVAGNTLSTFVTWPLSVGANVKTTEQSDPLVRALNASLAFSSANSPTPQTSKVLWAEDMSVFRSNWQTAASPGISYSDGSKLVLESPNNSGCAAIVRLPTNLDFEKYHYLTMRMRASSEAVFYIRPALQGLQAYVTTAPVALEARHGNGITDAGWETVTFNMKTMMDTYKPQTRVIDSIWLVTQRDTNVAMPLQNMRLEVDWMAINSGITPDVLSPQETIFTNNLDDDGDGLVDRDDENYRHTYPTQVLALYQTIFRNINAPGFSGQRTSLTGGSPITIDPTAISPNGRGKRSIRCTYYPLDYVRNPNYEPSGYVEFSDEGSNGIWSPCNSAFVSPTEQFRSLDYSALGALEEYNLESSTWTSAQTDLARRYGLDGFIFNDLGVNDYIANSAPLNAIDTSLNQQNVVWADKPFKLSSFYAGIGLKDLSPTVQATINDLTFLWKSRSAALGGCIRFRNKPVIFCFPSDNTKFTSAQWDQIFQGLLNPDAVNYDGAFSAPYAVPGSNATANVLTFNFDRWDASNVPGQMDMLEFYDKDMHKISFVDFGDPAYRPLLLNGWSWDVPATPSQNFSYVHITSALGGTTGKAQLNVAIPANACYLGLKMLAWGNSANVGGVQQYCELRINTSGAAGVRFPTRYGWSFYLLHLRNLPAGFTMSGEVDTPLTELPLSLWGDLPQYVGGVDDPVARTHGFDGSAYYPSSFKDTRVEVSSPRLTAGTVRPGFDDSGFYYYCSGSRPWLYPRNGNATFRKEWESLIACGSDMAIVSTWNEFGEGTNIEPDIEHGFSTVRLNLTYSLIFKGLIETGLLPSNTNFTVLRYDLDGASRTIQFSLTGRDTIAIKGVKFGADGRSITSVTRNGQSLSLSGPEVSVADSGTECPTLKITSPTGTNTYVVTYSYPAQYRMKIDDAFDNNNVQPSGSSSGWSVLGSTAGDTSMNSTSYDSESGAYKVSVNASPRVRSLGWSSNRAEWLPYSAIGTANYVRAKFYVYAEPPEGQGSFANLNQIPNFQIRLSNRFAVTNNLSVYLHNQLDSAYDPMTLELRPSTDPAYPSVYRLDMDPVDVPYLSTSTTGEGVMSGVEVFTLEPQDAGSICLSELVMGTYPASVIADGNALQTKIYAPGASDAGNLRAYTPAVELRRFNYVPAPPTAPPGTMLAMETTGVLAQYAEDATGVTIDSTAVPSNRIAFLERAFFPGALDGSPDNVNRIRVEPGKQYKVRWHITSTRNTSQQAWLWLTHRTLRFSYGQSMQLGGPCAAASTSNRTLAQQTLPGIGCLNSDQRTPGEAGGWYTAIINTPMAEDIRPEFSAGTPVSTRMPRISAQPGPGVNATSARDLKMLATLYDTMSTASGADSEGGQFKIDRIEVRVYNKVDD